MSLRCYAPPRPSCADPASSTSGYCSVARDEARDGSDVDLFVDPDYERFGFVKLIRVEDRLSRELGSAVDLTTRDGLHPHLRPAIEREAIQVL